MSEPARLTPEALLSEAEWIRSLARALTANSAVAEELEQEVWVAALRSRTTLRGGLRPWLAQVMRNAARSIARSDAARGARERDAARDERLPSTRDIVERAEAQRIVVEEVLALPEPFRSTVLWCYVDGRSPAEIAEQLSIPSATVRSRLTRALDRLRERLRVRLGPEDGDPGDSPRAGRLRGLAALLQLEPAQPALLSVPAAAGGLLLMKKLAVIVVAVLAVGWWIARKGAEQAPSTSSASIESTTVERAGGAVTTTESSEAHASAREAAPEVPAPPAIVESARRHRARLVDERTGEPAAFFTLRVSTGGEESIERTTDADGELLLDGSARLDLAENEAGQDRIQTRPDALARLPRFVDAAFAPQSPEPLDIRIPLGPTYFLRVAPPAGATLADLSATLVPADPRQAFDSAFAEVRADATPWVRFRPAALFLGGAPPYRLKLATRDGLWFGEAEVPSNIGVQRDPVAIEFEHRARLSGRVTNDAGQPIVNQLIRVELPGASFASASNRPVFVRVDERGRYDFHCLPRGVYTVRIEAEHHRPLQQSIELAAGEARELDLVVERLPPGELVKLSGRVVSETGAFEKRLYIAAIPEDPKGPRRQATVQWSTVEGRKIGLFELEVAPGSHRLSLQAAGLLEVAPREQLWTPEAPLPEFLVRDRGEFGAVVFRARDPETGDPLAPLRVRLTLNGDDQARFAAATSSGPEVRFEHVPIGRTCSYRVDSDGRQAQWGEVRVESSDVATIDALLPPGWSSEVNVVDAAGQALPGVRVFFDDSLVGVSDASGELRVSLGREPRSARAELDGWRGVESSSYSVETGRFRAWLPWLTLQLERVD
jgi:RNA polymerase sigma-70 factor (ECF subfamily)